jgi:hypothetical protein
MDSCAQNIKDDPDTQLHVDVSITTCVLGIRGILHAKKCVEIRYIGVQILSVHEAGYILDISQECLEKS